MVPLEKSTKNHNKNGTILEKFQNSATKKVPFEYNLKNLKNQNMVPFGQSAKNLKQKRYHLRKVQNISGKNGTISENDRN